MPRIIKAETALQRKAQLTTRPSFAEFNYVGDLALGGQIHFRFAYAPSEDASKAVRYGLFVQYREGGMGPVAIVLNKRSAARFNEEARYGLLPALCWLNVPARFLVS